MKRAQITIFMLVGIVMIAVIGFIFVNQGTVQQAQIDSSKDKLVTNSMAASQIEFLVQSCLDKAFEDSLTLITRQGGYIHQNQLGSMLTFALPNLNYSFENKSYQVTYRITPNRKDILPKYPCKDESEAPNFCYYANDVSKFASLSQITYGSSSSIILDNPKSFLTIQKQLQRYIETNTLSCINFSRFIGYNVTLGNASSTVSITDESVSTSLTMPMTITIQNLAPTINKFKFSSFQPVRLKKVHNAIQEVLNFDNRDINFNLKEDSAKGTYTNYQGQKIFKLSALNLEIQKIPSIENYDDIFIFTDQKSSLGGKPLHYIIARKNRMPALDIIPTNSNSLDYEILISPGQKLEFKPLAHDPDEDKITYSYKAFGDSTSIAEALRDSMQYQEDDCENRCASYELGPEDEGLHTITITATDGEHTDFQNVRIKVVSSILALPDLYNLYGQKLFAFEEPYYLDARSSLTPDPTGDYNFIWFDSFKDTTKTSLPEIEQMTDSQISTDDLIKEECLFKWGSSLVRCNEETPFLDIKTSVPLNPTQAATYPTIKPQFQFNAVESRHNMTLGLKLIAGETSIDSIETENVQVTECIPHNNPSSIYPKFNLGYPYMYAQILSPDAETHDLSDFTSDDFLASNVCCEPNGQVKENTNVCFDLKYNSFDLTLHKTKLELIGYNLLEIIKTQIVKDKSDGGLSALSSVVPTQNTCTTDVCKISFKQFCGSRGNACSGNIEYIVSDS
jgi:hypothetical protein